MNDEAARALSQGAVSNFGGLWNLRTMTPDEDGLYDPRMFSGESSGHIELSAPAVHPWFRPLVTEFLGLDAAELDDVIAHQAGWLGEDWGDWEAGEFMPRDDEDDPDDILDDTDEIPIVTGLAGIDIALGGIELEPQHRALLTAWSIRAVDLLVRVLPVLPCRFRGRPSECEASPIDTAYLAVGQASNTLSRLTELGAPASVLAYQDVQLQTAVDRLFDNRAQSKRIEAIDGSPAPDLGYVLDQQASSNDMVAVLRACRLEVHSA